MRAIASIDRAKELILDGVSVWLAAEGTRSFDGRIGPLKKGGFHLATETGTPIVPVSIRGTIDILKRGARAMQKGKHVEVVIGEPIAVEGRSMDDLMAEVRAFLVENVEK